MTYEQVAAAWLGTLGIVVGMSKWAWGNVKRQFGDFVGQVDDRNADLGLDRSVDVEYVARDYLVPFRSGNMQRYLDRNSFPRDRYLSELKDGVGRPYGLALSATLLVALLVVMFSGPLLYRQWGMAFAVEYFAALYALILANLVAYFLL